MLDFKHLQEFENNYKDLLTYLDKIHIMQVRYYLLTESLSETQLKSALDKEKQRLFINEEKIKPFEAEKP
jgi:hypothetical protein